MSTSIEPAVPQVLLVDADRPLGGLLQAWLAEQGCALVLALSVEPAYTGRVDLVLVDLPFPRQGGVDLIRRITLQHPRVPIVALSSCFFSGVECSGPVARTLGVACVLPKPASREALLGAVRRLLPGR